MHELTASDAAARIRSGKLTSVSLVSACLARIEAREPEVGAWQYIDPDLALEQARNADRSQSRGPLHGAPIGGQLIATPSADDRLLQVAGRVRR